MRGELKCRRMRCSFSVEKVKSGLRLQTLVHEIFACEGQVRLLNSHYAFQALFNQLAWSWLWMRCSAIITELTMPPVMLTILAPSLNSFYKNTSTFDCRLSHYENHWLFNFFSSSSISFNLPFPTPSQIISLPFLQLLFLLVVLTGL